MLKHYKYDPIDNTNIDKCIHCLLGSNQMIRQGIYYELCSFYVLIKQIVCQ
jgi:hypothetical protein